MNTQPKPLFPPYTLWLIIAGILAGWIVGMGLNLAQKLEFESAALLRPLRPSGEQPDVPEHQWVNTEAAAMGSKETLSRAAKNLNLAAEWNVSDEECIKALNKMLTIETVSNSSLIRVKARSPKVAEGTSIVNAVVAARSQFYQEKYSGGPDDPIAARAAHVDALSTSCVQKRKALLSALEAAKRLPESTYDADLKSLTLPKDLEKLRDDWIAESAKLTQLLEAPPARAPDYAEILEPATPSMNAVDHGIRARYNTWIAIGAGTGVLLSLILGRFGNPSQNTPRPQAPASEY